jgi:hypothetical protein
VHCGLALENTQRTEKVNTMDLLLRTLEELAVIVVVFWMLGMYDDEKNR